MYAFEDNQDDMSKKMKMGSFNGMDLDKNLLSGLNRMQYKVPTPVQRKTLPIALAGMDIVCMSRTGSGKTAAFLIPMFQKFNKHDSTGGIRGIVLSPTRELAVQTYRFAKDMAKFMDLRVVSIIGGDPIEPQFEALANRPDMIIATPGRLMHHLSEISTFTLKGCKYLVFDEADRLFEMGFADQLNAIVKECSGDRQTLLFSATMPRQLLQFTRAGLREPQLIRLESESKTSDELRMAFFTVRSNEKVASLLYLVRSIIPKEHMTIVFTATRHHSEYIHHLFQKIGVTSTVVYGSMDQDLRTSNLKDFRNGKISYLIVTDLAARGIDVPLLNNVINLHFPPSPKLFVHRCGRAARQGRIGYAFSLIEPEEMGYMVDVHTFLGKDVCNSYGIESTEQLVDGSSSTTNSSTNTSKIGSSRSHKGNVGGTSIVPVTHHNQGYKLNEFLPEFIHTGLIPQDAIDEENDYVQRLMREEEHVATLNRIADNGMQQYRRTRNEATATGISIAKKLVKSNAIVAIHPLICGEDPAHCSRDSIEKANFIRILQTFRPAQTVLETGIGTGTGSSIIKGKGLKDKGTGKFNVSQHGDTNGVAIMQALRKTTTMSLERNKERRKELYENFQQSKLNDPSLNPLEKDESVSHAAPDPLTLTSEEIQLQNESNKKKANKKANKKSSKGKGNTADDDNDVWAQLEAISTAHEGRGAGDFDGAGDDVRDEYIGDEGAHASSSLGKGKGTKRKASDGNSSSGERLSSSSVNGNIEDVESGSWNRKVRISASERKRMKKGAGNGNSSSNPFVENDANNNALVDGYDKGSNNYADSKYYMAYGTEDQKASFAEDSLQPHSGLKTAEAQHAAMMEAAMIDVNPDEANDMNNKRRIMRWDAKKRKYVKQSLSEIANLKGANKGRSEMGAVGGKGKKPVGDMYNKWAKKTHREINTFKVMADIGQDTFHDMDGKVPNFKNNLDVPSELKNEQEIRKNKKVKENLRIKNLPKEKRRGIENAGRKKKNEKAKGDDKKSKFVHKAARKQVKAIVTGGGGGRKGKR
jgi:superfamily II DNA/RNA helicase